MSASKRMQTAISTTLNKTKLQMDQSLNRSPGTLNLIEEKPRNSLKLIGTGNHFVDRALRSTINKWNLIK